MSRLIKEKSAGNLWGKILKRQACGIHSIGVE